VGQNTREAPHRSGGGGHFGGEGGDEFRRLTRRAPAFVIFVEPSERANLESALSKLPAPGIGERLAVRRAVAVFVALERFHSLRSLFSFIVGGFFLRKNPFRIMVSGYSNCGTAVTQFLSHRIRKLLLSSRRDHPGFPTTGFRRWGGEQQGAAILHNPKRRSNSGIAIFLSFIVAGSSGFRARADDLKPRVIVFVHGLHGDRETWRASNGAYWPQLLQTDPHFQKSDVVIAEYPTPSTHGQFSTEQLAQMLYQRLKQQRVWEHREVVFIAHSLGGILTEEMLLRHPADAARVLFIVSYATPHEGSFVANLAKIYDSDPLLTDLRASNDNSFLMDLEQRWRSTPTITRIHRYCAFEALDTAAGAGVGRYLRAHTRVVTYYSATYGCDADTPPQKILADHIDIVKPASRSADAYAFFATIYRSNPVIDVVESVRDNKVSGLNVDCNRTNSADDLQVPIALDPTLHEHLLSADVELADTHKVREISPTAVKQVDPNGIAHVSYAFRGQGRNLLLGCPTGHASILVHFKIRSEVPVKE
jgi:pimeloyl-ACP methyl ester carboxylesterase